MQGQHGTLMVAQSRELGTVCPAFVFKLKMLLLSNSKIRTIGDGAVFPG